MKNRKIKIGSFGENLARDFLKRKGYKVLKRNVKNKWGEIDIIAKRGNTLVFIEVKTRTSDFFGGSIRSLSFRKMERFKRAIQVFLSSPKLKQVDSLDVRADFIGVDLDLKKKVAKIRHVKNVGL